LKLRTSTAFRPRREAALKCTISLQGNIHAHHLPAEGSPAYCAFIVLEGEAIIQSLGRSSKPSFDSSRSSAFCLMSSISSTPNRTSGIAHAPVAALGFIGLTVLGMISLSKGRWLVNRSGSVWAGLTRWTCIMHW